MFPKFMIFDMDGLLFDTERLFMNMKAKVLEKYGYVHRDEDYIRTIGLARSMLYKELYAIYGEDYPAEQISIESQALVNEHIRVHGPGLMPGIPELLAWLKEQNIPCCIASSTRHKFVQQYVDRAGIGDYFSFILGGDEVEFSKPNPDIFLKACKKGGFEPADAMVFEDSENGILAAHSAGIPVVCIPDLKYPREEIANYTTNIFSDAYNCKEWLLNLRNESSIM